MADRWYSVDLYSEPVGVLTVRGNLTTFEFTESYLDQAHRPVLGQFFEEEPRGRWRQAQRVPVWFSNLLPEDGPLLDFLADQLEVSPRSEIRLLEALGADLPGAVTVRPLAEQLVEKTDRFDRLNALGDDHTAPQGGVRFSVAGVQLKLSMVTDSNTIRLAGRGELGDSFVKFPGTIPRIPENEFAMMTLAANCGLDVPPARLIPADALGPLPSWFESKRQANVYVIERFDRSTSGPIHMEDMNQVIGNWPDNKYRGLSYESLGRLILDFCGEDDFWEYFRRLTFNLAIGNEDAHLKNWSLIYPDRVNPRLSPLYDVLSTVIISGLTRETALKLGGNRRYRTVGTETMIQLAEIVGVSKDRAQKVLDQLWERLRAEEPPIRETDLLSDDDWANIDEYRRSVPLLRPLVI